MKKSYFIWAVLCVGVFTVGAVFAGANMLVFIHLPAFIIVVLAPALIVTATFGLSVFGRSFRIAFYPVPASRKDLETGIRLFRMMQNTLLLTGIVTTMLGLIAMLANLMDESQIGPNLSLALITLLYSLMFILVVAVPFKNALENRVREIDEPAGD